MKRLFLNNLVKRGRADCIGRTTASVLPERMAQSNAWRSAFPDQIAAL
jgi:hypothetical protein